MEFKSKCFQLLRMFIRRFCQLQLGLLLYGASLAMMVRADLGLNPWSVLHEGLSERTGISLGMTVNIVGALVLLVWIPLRQKPGIGTVCNVLVIGAAADAALSVLPPVTGLPLRIALLLSAILLNAAATGAYIGAGLGPGPRDGLTTGGVRLTGWDIRWMRGLIEGLVLLHGWMLGGTIGAGTLIYALANGPLLQFFIPLFEVRQTVRVRSGVVPAAAANDC
ncbi:hypothetical protein GGQ87_001971 [Brevundimonas alba]|uniref:Integral membrane protein n=1 Tax=Brevundimonas alba TaxID=74314 RepID=A0A7X5YL38_9CAUL|nr:hypothetical protein [Brevundimonas alba]NJC41713.1 hypothetical protein [Brevundimonas alba]